MIYSFPIEISEPLVWEYPVSHNNIKKVKSILIRFMHSSFEFFQKYVSDTAKWWGFRFLPNV